MAAREERLNTEGGPKGVVRRPRGTPDGAAGTGTGAVDGEKTAADLWRQRVVAAAWGGNCNMVRTIVNGLNSPVNSRL